MNYNLTFDEWKVVSKKHKLLLKQRIGKFYDKLEYKFFDIYLKDKDIKWFENNYKLA